MRVSMSDNFDRLPVSLLLFSMPSDFRPALSWFEAHFDVGAKLKAAKAERIQHHPVW